MKYLLSIYESEAAWESLPEAEQEKAFGEYMGLSADLRSSGKYVAAEPLQPVATASTVRVREGKTLVTDGPFAETREQLGGFYLIDVESLDEALAIAARIPGARTGGVEVRPVLPLPTP
jgi:hypothetical protein